MALSGELLNVTQQNAEAASFGRDAGSLAGRLSKSKAQCRAEPCAPVWPNYSAHFLPSRGSAAGAFVYKVDSECSACVLLA